MKRPLSLPYKRMVIAVVGVAILAFGASIMRAGGAGVDPYTAANFGVSDRLGIPLGTYQLVMNMIIFIPAIIWGRNTISYGTFINMILCGYFVQFFTGVLTGLTQDFDINPDHWMVKIIAVVFGILFFTYGSSLYMSAGLGEAPYDSLAIVITGHRSGAKYRTVRTIQDAFFFIIAVIFHGPWGIGTAVTVLAAGRCISQFNRRVNVPLVNKIVGDEPSRADEEKTPTSTS